MGSHGARLRRHPPRGARVICRALCGGRSGCTRLRLSPLGRFAGRAVSVLPVRRRREDWRCAVDYCRKRREVDPDRLVPWGYSFSGGVVVAEAVGDERIAAVLATCRHSPPRDDTAAPDERRRAGRVDCVSRAGGRSIRTGADGVDRVGGAVRDQRCRRVSRRALRSIPDARGDNQRASPEGVAVRAAWR